MILSEMNRQYSGSMYDDIDLAVQITDGDVSGIYRLDKDYRDDKILDSRLKQSNYTFHKMEEQSNEGDDSTIDSFNGRTLKKSTQEMRDVTDVEKAQCTLDKEELNEIQPIRTRQKRHTQLDVLRFTSVWFVVSCHIFPKLAFGNPMFGLYWVLQYLCLISGVSVAISRAPLWKISIRIILLTVVGCVLNTIPTIYRITRDPPIKPFRQNKIPNSIIFGMWYLIVLLIAASVVYPIKFAVNSEDKLKTYAIVIFAQTAFFFKLLVIGIIINTTYLQKNISEEFGNFGKEFGILELPFHLAYVMLGVILSTDMLYIVQRKREESKNIKSHHYPNEKEPGSLCGWILLLYVHLPILICPEHYFKRLGHYCLFFLYMVLGFVLYNAPLLGRRHIQNFINTLWPILCIFLLIATGLEMPRYENSVFPEDMLSRLRVSCGTFFFSLVFSACWCPSIDEKEAEETNDGETLRLLGPSWRLGSERITEWLSWWSLICYITHNCMMDWTALYFRHSLHIPEGTKEFSVVGFCLLIGILIGGYCRMQEIAKEKDIKRKKMGAESPDPEMTQMQPSYVSEPRSDRPCLENEHPEMMLKRPSYISQTD